MVGQQLVWIQSVPVIVVTRTVCPYLIEGAMNHVQMQLDRINYLNLVDLRAVSVKSTVMCQQYTVRHKVKCIYVASTRMVTIFLHFLLYTSDIHV